MDSRVDAIVLAGDRRDSHAVFGRNKAFLEIEGTPLLIHVLRALGRARCVGRAYVVGDPARMEDTLADAARRGVDLPIEVVPQAEDVWENFWGAFTATLSPATRDRIAAGATPESAASPEERDRFVFALPGDVPLIQPAEIDAFVSAAARTEADYVAGVTPDWSLEPFYPAGDRPGIRMAYFNMREGRYRQNNLHLARPLRVTARERIERLYRHRYQRNLRDAARLGVAIARTRAVGASTLWGFALLHVAMKLDLRGRRRTSDFVRRFLPMARAELAISRMLGGNFRMLPVVTPGAALDVDQESDYEALRACFAEWGARLAGGVGSADAPLAANARADSAVTGGPASKAQADSSTAGGPASKARADSSTK